MNGYHRNPENQRFIRYTVYDRGHLVFTSLDKDEASDDLETRKDMVLNSLSRFGVIIHSGIDLGLYLKEETCDLKGYIISSIIIPTEPDIPARVYETLNNSYVNQQFRVPVDYRYQNIQTYNNQQYEIPPVRRFANSINCSDCKRCATTRMMRTCARPPQQIFSDSRNAGDMYDKCDSQCYSPFDQDDQYDILTPSDMDDQHSNQLPKENNRTRQPIQITRAPRRVVRRVETDDIESNHSNSNRESNEPALSKIMQNRIVSNTNKHIQNNGVNMETEFAKLAASITKIINKEDVNVEDVYPDIRDEIQLDKEITKMENEFIDDTSSESDSDSSDNYYDKMMKIRTKKDNHDSDTDSDEFGDRKRRHDRGDFSEESQDQDEIPDDMPAQFKQQFHQLLEARNIAANKIKEQEELVRKANENLNEEQFKERCKVQDEKKAKKKREENLSMLSANKITYLKIRSKIVKEIMKENNIPFMFNDKYCIFRYMELNELLDLGSNVEIESELRIYEALHKAIESRELENDENIQNNSDSDSESEYVPLADVDEDLLEICFDFLDFVEQNFPDTMTEAKIHENLNKNMQVDDEIFRRDVNNAGVSKHDENVDDGDSDDPGMYNHNYK